MSLLIMRIYWVMLSKRHSAPEWSQERSDWFDYEVVGLKRNA